MSDVHGGNQFDQPIVSGNSLFFHTYTSNYVEFTKLRDCVEKKIVLLLNIDVDVSFECTRVVMRLKFRSFLFGVPLVFKFNLEKEINITWSDEEGRYDK